MNLDNIENIWHSLQAKPGEGRPEESAMQNGLPDSVAKLLPVLDDFKHLREQQPPTPKQIGPYQIIDWLGEGGMGIVYKCSSPAHDKPIAIKVIKPGNLFFCGSERFEREARVAASLDHPNIVPIYDIGTKTPYYTMRLIDGPNLASLAHTDWSEKAGSAAEVRARRLARTLANDWQLQAHVGSQCLRALSYAHAQGIVHRDVKPANLIIDSNFHVWVTDFGLAKQLIEQHSLSAKSKLLGTPRYMSPEQIRGDADERSDIFGLGLVLYEMALLRADGRNTRQAIWKGGLRPIRDWNEAVPPRYEEIILKAVDADPNRRFQTANEFQDALKCLFASSVRSGLAGHAHIDKRDTEERDTEEDPSTQRSRVFASSLFVLPLFYILSLVAMSLLPSGTWALFGSEFGCEDPAQGDLFSTEDQMRINPKEPLIQRLSYHSKGVAFDSLGAGTVVYTSLYQDGDDYGLYARNLDANGPVGEEFLVTTTTKGDQKHGTVVCLSNGDRIIAWDSNRDRDENATEVMIRKFSASGVPLSEEIQVNTEMLHYQLYPSIAVNSKDEITVAWRSKHQDGDSYGVFMRRFSPDLCPLTDEIQVNAQSLGQQKNPMIAIGPNDELVVSWHSKVRDEAKWSIHARCFDENLRPLSSDFLVAGEPNASSTYPRVAFGRQGDLLVVYRHVERNSIDSIRCRRFTSLGEPLSEQIEVSPKDHLSARNCSVVCGSDGSFLVAWQSTYEDPTGNDVFARLLYPDGTVRSNVIRVNDERLGEQQLPWAAITDDFRTLIIWSGLGPQDERGVHAKWLSYEPLAHSLGKEQLNSLSVKHNRNALRDY